MAYFCKIVNDEVVLDFNGINDYKLDSYEQFLKFVSADKYNLTKLNEDICTGLIDSAKLELGEMLIGKFDSVHETMAYVRIMQNVTNFIYTMNLEKENKIKEEYFRNLPGPGEDF